MAERKKYNFGNAAKILTNTATDDRAVKGENQPMEEPGTDKEVTAGKRPVQEQLKRLDARPGSAKAFNFKYIPREKLVFHSDNHYPMEEIKKLGETILRFGLIHNLEVLYDEETDTYIIESGERRTRAIDELVERFKDASDSDPDYQMYLMNVKQYVDEGYPCNVKRQNPLASEKMTEKEALISQIESKIRLRLANEEVRNQNPARTQAAVMELADLYSQLNELLMRKDKINVNEMVAKEMGLSKSQVKNYKAAEQLIPELKELFENKGITLKESVSYAKLPEEDQLQIVRLIQEGGNKEELKLLSQKLTDMEAEVRKKESELQELENEKAGALRRAEEQKKNALELEEKIRLEMRNEADEKGKADRKAIEELQGQLEAAHQNIRQYEQEHKRIEELQAQKVAELEEKLAKKGETKNVMSSVMKVSLQLENILNAIAGYMEQFEKTLDEYEHIYDISSGEPTPEDYKRKMEQILKKCYSNEERINTDKENQQLSGQMDIEDYPEVLPKNK